MLYFASKLNHIAIADSESHSESNSESDAKSDSESDSESNSKSNSESNSCANTSTWRSLFCIHHLWTMFGCRVDWI